MAANDKCLVTIEGVEYDLSVWKDYHPGGKLIVEQYNEKSATDIFHAMHGPEAFEKLSKMKGTPKEEQSEDYIVAFRELRKRLIEEGYFTSNKLWIFYKMISTVMILVFGIIATYLDHWFIGSVLVGISWQQLGWLGHDACHHNLFQNRKLNNFFAYIYGNLLSGFSVNWWKDRHNTHHAITNVLDADPDVDNLPLFVWSVDDIHRVSSAGGPLAEYIIPYQQYYFIPFTLSLKLIWCIQSIFFVNNKSVQNKSYLKSLNAEKITLILHYLGLLPVLWMTPSLGAAINFFFISEGIAGAGIALIVFMNHYACEQLKNENGKQANFLQLQLHTTRNINSDIFMDWIAGGLNYQIEHHLFPTMPRHNLSKVKPIIQQFCKDHNLPYESLSFLECLTCVENKLADVAATYTKIVSKVE